MSFRFAPPDMSQAVPLSLPKAAPVAAKQQAALPEFSTESGPKPWLTQTQTQSIPWMDRSTYGVKNRMLAYGAGGLAVLVLGYVFFKRKSLSVAGYRRRSRR